MKGNDCKQQYVTRNILWSKTNLSHQVDIRRGISDTFSKGRVLKQPFYLRSSDSQQLQQVEMNCFQDTAQLELTDFLPSDSKSIDTPGEISNSMNQCRVPLRLIEHVLVH